MVVFLLFVIYTFFTKLDELDFYRRYQIKKYLNNDGMRNLNRFSIKELQRFKEIISKEIDYLVRERRYLPLNSEKISEISANIDQLEFKEAKIIDTIKIHHG